MVYLDSAGNSGETDDTLRCQLVIFVKTKSAAKFLFTKASHLKGKIKKYKYAKTVASWEKDGKVKAISLILLPHTEESFKVMRQLTIPPRPPFPLPLPPWEEGEEKKKAGESLSRA